jgi:hypothetical protein
MSFIQFHCNPIKFGSARKDVNVVYGLNIGLELQVESSNHVLKTPPSQCGLGFSRPS